MLTWEQSAKTFVARVRPLTDWNEVDAESPPVDISWKVKDA